MRRSVFVFLAAACLCAQPEARVEDSSHYSRVFGEQRNYRVFLPPDYDANAAERYPVIYFFHGWGERYNRPPQSGGGYDSGEGGYRGDTIARFVGSNKVIVVKWDGYNPRKPGEAYPRPYNISPVETYRQFPLYFPELAAHIDSKYRTIADRDHRATAGLSMGGFLSFWVAGKYPHLVGSASNFMGSSEFFAGPNGFPSEYRHTEMHLNYDGLRTRLVTGSRDFIRWYHALMIARWDVVRPQFEHEDFDSEHGTPGMAKTLGFHMAAFRNPLPRPAVWRHADVYPVFDVWGYSVQTDRRTPGFTLLEQVSRSGFRVSVREWLPNGRLLPAVEVRIATDAIYTPGRRYRITDVDLATGAVARLDSRADESGRLHLQTAGGLHDIGITDKTEPLVTVAGWSVSGDRLRLKLLNKGTAPAAMVRGMVQQRPFSVAKLGSGESVETQDIAIRRGERVVAVLNGVEHPVDVPPAEPTVALNDAVIVDGARVRVWRRAVRQEELTLGAGNGDGVPQAGEQIVIAIRDGEALRLAEVTSPHPCVDLSRRVSDDWSAYDHVGATAKYTVLQLASSCRTAGAIPLSVEYQLPNKPEHLLKRAVVSLQILASDKTAPQVESAWVDGWNGLRVRIADGSAVRSAVVTLTLGESVLTVPLNDAGTGADREAGDGVFSGLAPNPRSGRYKVQVEAEDSLGNRATHTLADELAF